MDKINFMKTTVIIPAFNAERYIKETIDSALGQTVPCRVIVVNDGSTDQTLDIANRYVGKITILSQTNQGTAAALNAGLRVTDTPYFVFLCADDLLLPDYLATAEKILDEKPEIDIVVPDIQVFGNENFYWGAEGFSDAIYDHNTIFTHSLVRKSLADKLNGFEEKMPYPGWEDWDFWIRAYQKGAVAHLLKKVYVHYRSHDKNTSKIVVTPHLAEMRQWMRDHRHI